MASSSTSSIHKSFKYDVFLSFRGEDTRTNFIDHLYYALQQKSIHTYKDDEKIKKGKRISDELIGSIEDSKFYIIVFSKNYASSSWCLDELVKIMECHKTTEHTAYPVFYDVEPTEIRKQSGAVKESFAKHDNKEAAAKWRDALKEASDLAGWELKNTVDRHEAKFIQKIVEEISLELRTINFSIDKKLIGMKTRVEIAVSSLEIGVDDVRMMGIKGMGGGGKTTLARAIFDHISLHFDGKSFVENVREVSKASLSGLKLLQNQVLSDVLNDQRINVSSVYDGRNMLKRMMSCRKVLLVLDDVDHIDQLEALAGDPDWFKSGSRIIVTTRDEQVLIAHRVKLIRNVDLLSDKEAICLFSRYAFGQEIPIQGYEEISREVIRYASGLPLTIKVLGSFLCGKDNLEWKDALERLKNIPLMETLQKLELSYIGLEEDYKEILLDVACMLKGQPKNSVIKALQSCGFYARNGLKVLEQKSLITVSGYLERVEMHDHIEEMAKNIVRRSHPDTPYMHSRLWVNEEIEDILTNDLATEATRCIQLYTDHLPPEWVMKGLKKMKELQFLDVFVGDKSTISNRLCRNPMYLKFPNALRYLEWRGYPFRSLPETFEANNLVSLYMSHSGMVQLWEGRETKVLTKLRFLELASLKLKTLDLGFAPNLEMLTIRDCYYLVAVHLPLKSLNLETFSARGCHNLVKLRMPIEYPKFRSFFLHSSKLRKLDIGSATHLENLHLDCCQDLIALHMYGRYLNLTFIKLNFSKLRKLDLLLAPHVENVHIHKCDDLEELLMNDRYLNLTSLELSCSKLKKFELGSAPHLKNLHLHECKDLTELRMDDQYLNLTSIKLNCFKLSKLDLRLAPHLKNLHLDKCEDLIELDMHDRYLNLTSIKLNCPKLKKLDLGSALHLEYLQLHECEDLEELHMHGRYLNLTSIELSCSKLNTLDLGLAPHLEELRLYGCHSLLELHMPVKLELRYINLFCSKLRKLDLGSAPYLEHLHLYGCLDLEDINIPVELKLRSIKIFCSKIRKLDLRSTPHLEQLHIYGCIHLVQLYMPVELELTSLYLFSTKLRNLDLRSATHLENLHLYGCMELVEIHMPVEPKLKSMYFFSTKLRKLDLGSAMHLKKLHLQECQDFVELYMHGRYLNLTSLKLTRAKLRILDLGPVPNLENLHLHECQDLVEVHIPIELKLRSLYLIGSKLRKLDLGSAPHLKNLHLVECQDLVELHMQCIYLDLTSIKLNCSRLRTLDLTLTPNLQKLDLRGCSNLIELHAGCIEKFICLNISDSLRFNNFLFQPKDILHMVAPSAQLYLMAETLERCQFHPDNNLPKFRLACFIIKVYCP